VNYTVYLASSPVSDHATFDEAADVYRVLALSNGVNVRNGERSDVDDDGLTEEEKQTLDEIHNAAVGMFRQLKTIVGAL
jgi:hypothetical protein